MSNVLIKIIIAMEQVTQVDDNYVIKKIESLYKKLKDIPSLNSGGCGIAAYGVYKYLSLHCPEIAKDINMVFLYGTWDSKRDKTINRQSFNKNKQFEIIPTHIVLKYKKHYFDSNCVNRKCHFNGQRTIQIFEKDFIMPLLKLINDKKSYWNNSFNRNYLNSIEVLLGVKLNEIRRK
jgi:hypothetical protein